MQILADLYGYSFRKVTELTVRGLRSIGYRYINVVSLWLPLNMVSRASLVVGDTVIAIRLASRLGVPKTYWVDSPLEVTGEEARMLSDSDCLYTTLPHWCRYYNKAGLRCSGYIPRPIDVDTAERALSASCRDLHEKFGSYVVNVASDHVIAPPRRPRKGLDLFDAVCENLKSKQIKCVAVSNWSLRNAATIRAGSLSEYELLRLIKCAKLFLFTSRSEGFGMPPVEAMAVKQLVVVPNTPVFSHVIGVKYDYEAEIRELIPEVGGFYVGWDYSVESILDAVDYALGLPPEEREAIVEKSYLASKAYSPVSIALALSEVI